VTHETLPFEVTAMSKHPFPVPAQCGAILTALAAARCFSLSGNTPLGKVLLPLAVLALAAGALLLLTRSGYDRSAVLSMLLPIGLALFLRAVLLPHATLDYQDFLSRWVEHFRQNGGFAAIKDPVGNYNVPYLYLLALLSCLPFPDLYGIKLFSIVFDFLLAWGAFRLVRCLTQDKKAPLWAFSVLLLLPTVLLNGSCWGQCDSVWAALCVLALACALEDRPWPSLILLGLAFSFKLQAIFILPLWLPLWLSGKVKFKHLWAFPAAFFAAIAPALLLGKPLKDILGVYVGQTTDSIGWGTLNYNSPSVFTLAPYGAEYPPYASKAAIVLAFLLMLYVLALLLWNRRHLTNAAWVLAGAALSLGIPFFLPYMHERYFFLGGVLLAVLACARPVHAPAAVAAELASLGGYHAYLAQKYFLLVRLFGLTWTQLLEGLLMLTAVSLTIVALVRELRSPPAAV